MSVLALDISGIPQQWISYEDAIFYHATDSVAWSLGEVVARFRGGTQKDGTMSYLETTSIIAVSGHGLKTRGRVALTNNTLFGRDRCTCAYCGDTFAPAKLSRDHIIPRSKGGLDVWMNVVTACKACNSAKDCKTLKQAGLELLYVPYEPNHYEHLILQKRNILTDQMDYLKSGLPKYSRVLLN